MRTHDHQDPNGDTFPERTPPAAITARPVDYDPRASADTPSLLLRARVRLGRNGLDHQIACGRRCDDTPALALRARQLTDRELRRSTAGTFRRLVDFADRVGPDRVMSAVVVDRSSVAMGREAILGLAERLEGPVPVSARGMAMARQLVVDGTSPLFGRRRGFTLLDAVWAVADALTVIDQRRSTLA